MPVRGWIVNGTYWFDYVFFYAYNGSQVLHFDYQQGAELLPFSEWLQPDEDRMVGHAAADPLATHLGDWEHAQVHVSADLAQIIELRLFNHGDPTVVQNRPGSHDWSHIRFNGTHPVVYSALHSHATYGAPGHYTEGIPGVDLVAGCDWCADGGATWQAWDHLLPFGVEPDGKGQAAFTDSLWVDFWPHRWGRSRSFDFLDPLRVSAIGPHAPGLVTGTVQVVLHAALVGGTAAKWTWGDTMLTDGAAVSPPDWWLKGH
jgi:VPS62-like protein